MRSGPAFRPSTRSSPHVQPGLHPNILRGNPDVARRQSVSTKDWTTESTRRRARSREWNLRATGRRRADRKPDLLSIRLSDSGVVLPPAAAGRSEPGATFQGASEGGAGRMIGVVLRRRRIQIAISEETFATGRNSCFPRQVLTG